MKFDNKVALISGINGFIGSNLTGLLMEQGCKVASLPRELLLDPVALQGYIEEVHPDFIFHLASYGNHHEQTQEDEIFSTNVFKTYALLSASLKTKYTAFINISTSSVYGKQDKPLSEESSLNGTGFYARTKICGEQMATAFAEKFDKPIVNVRPFSVYGPGEALHRFIPTIIKSIYTGEKLTVFPEPVHDWIYIEDFINGLFAVLDNSYELKGQSINIGTGIQTSNSAVLDEILAMSGAKMEAEYKSSDRDNDTTTWCADISKIKSLGWTPEFDLKKGIRETFEYYKGYFMQKNKAPTLKDAMDQSLKMSGAEWN